MKSRLAQRSLGKRRIGDGMAANPGFRSRQRPPRNFSAATGRFFTALFLGACLVFTLGSLMPLMAQTPQPPAARLIAQASPAAAPNGEDVLPSRPPAAPPAPSLPTDIENHWASECIRQLAQRQLVPVTDQAEFFPDEPATWAVVTEVLNRSFPTDGAYTGANPIETALELPSPVTMLYAYPSHFYVPDRTITRAEAITALAAKKALPYTARVNDLLAASLVDGQQVPDYGREGVAAALAAGVLANYPDARQVEANRVITRGELAALVCRAREESDLRSAIAPQWFARPADLPAQEQPLSELRGVWLTNIDSDVLFSREALADGIQRLKAMHINTLYPVVWNFGYPQFPSATAERILGQKQRLWPGENPQFEAAQGDRDMLQELIDLAHAEGMAVIPWFEFGFMAPADYALLEQHPDWFTQRQDGTREIQQGVETFTWMNPFHPRVQQLLFLLIKEVLENYDVEGIQVDDHLGLPVDMGYDPFTVNLYQQDHEGQLPPEDYSDPAWMRWRADKITQFMAGVKQLVDRYQPDGILSVSPNPYPFSYARYLQDWPTWNNQGLVDELIIQIYRNDLDRFAWELNKPATVDAKRTTPTSIGLLSGLRGRPTDVALLTEQLQAVRDRGYAGVSYFFYQSLWDPGQETLEERTTEFRSSFAQPAVRPLK